MTHFTAAKALTSLFERHVRPTCKDEDLARKQYIFNVLILGLTLLTTVAFFITAIRHMAEGGTPNNSSPLLFLVLTVLLIFLKELAHRQFRKWAIYSFTLLYFMIGTYALYKYSYILPHGLLIYALVIIVAGILISARASLGMLILVTLSLSILAYIQNQRISVPYVAELNDPMRTNLVSYIFIFLIIFLVSWLSNREIEKSLARARKSEKMLRRERNSLEAKVRMRTRELERAQAEKMHELYKFAEFGRISSSILHDLANPLTAVSLNLNLAEERHKSEHIKHIRQGIDHIERYVESARQQLRHQSEQKNFDTQREIERVVSFLLSKAQSKEIKINLSLQTDVWLYGDSSKFGQIFSNLIGNALEASEDIKPLSKRKITVKSKFLKTTNEVVFEVSDNGDGIDKSKINHIFESFFTTKGDKGTGLGLFITKRIVEEDFKGKIKIKSQSRQGTSFLVHIPSQGKNENNS